MYLSNILRLYFTMTVIPALLSMHKPCLADVTPGELDSDATRLEA